MSKYRPPHPDAVQGLPHGAERHTRQPYAAELDDYAGGLLKAPEEQTGVAPGEPKPEKPRRPAPRIRGAPLDVAALLSLFDDLPDERDDSRRD